MTRQEFEQKKKDLKPLNDILNIMVFFDILAFAGSIIWLIWGGGSPAWKTFGTTLFLFVFLLLIYGISCYKYYKEGAEDELIDEERPRNRIPFYTDPYNELNRNDANDNVNGITFN